MKRLKYLDGLKIIFCFWVVIYHYWDVLSHRDMSLCFAFLPEKLYKRGSLGVEFFFVLSGFLIAYTYKKKISDKDIGIFSFLKKRIVSIYPMYFVACTLGVVVDVICKKQITVLNLLLSYTMTSAGWLTFRYPFGTAIWFVNVLILCYIFYAAIAGLCRDKYVYLGITAVMCVIGVFCLLSGSNIPFLFFVNGRGYLSFFVGCLLYEIQSGIDEKILTKIAYVCTALLVTILLVYKATGMFNIFKYKDLTFSLFVYPIVLFSVNNIKLLQKIFDNRLINKIAELSTSIYFVNYSLMNMIQIADEKCDLNLDFSRGIVFWGTMILVVVISVIFKVLVEEKLTDYVKAKLT